MFVKSLGLLTPVAVGGLYVTGAFGGDAYERTVPKPPAQVMAALADLDVREQPGEPGTDSSRSGGVPSLFEVERGTDSITWKVMSGDKVAIRMTAHLQPLPDGASTRVTASVERGDAPDDFVAPAFRSEGVTLGLFQAALETELNELAAPPQRSAEACRELAEKLLMTEGMNAELGFGGTAKTIMKLSAAEAEMRRQGCPTDAPAGDFEQVSDRMGSGPSGGVPDGVSFEPGKPMVDLSRD